jgi:ABC-type tungstate transport system substrate-binding protein
MRELTLLETGYLAGGLLLGLVLPLLMSFRGPLDAANRRSCLRSVWTGQTLLAMAGLAVLVSPRFAPYAAMFGLASCLACALVLLRQFRAPQTA